MDETQQVEQEPIELDPAQWNKVESVLENHIENVVPEDSHDRRRTQLILRRIVYQRSADYGGKDEQ